MPCMLPVSLCQTNPVSPDQTTISCKKGHPAWYLPSPFQSYKAMVCSVPILRPTLKAGEEGHRAKPVNVSNSADPRLFQALR